MFYRISVLYKLNHEFISGKKLSLIPRLSLQVLGRSPSNLTPWWHRLCARSWTESGCLAVSELTSAPQSSISHRHRASYSRAHQPTAKQPLQSPPLPTSEWHHVLSASPSIPDSKLTTILNYIIYYFPSTDIYKDSWVVYNNAERGDIFNFFFFSCNGSRQDKELGMFRAFLQSKNLLLYVCPPNHHHQAGTSTVCSLMRENLGGCYGFPLFTAILTFVSPVTSPMPGSKQTFHKMFDGWMKAERKTKVWSLWLLLTEKSTSSPVFQQSPFRKWSYVLPRAYQ